MDFHQTCKGETIHRIYGALRFSGHDSVHDSVPPSFNTARFTQVYTKIVTNYQLAAN